MKTKNLFRLLFRLFGNLGFHRQFVGDHALPLLLFLFLLLLLIDGFFGRFGFERGVIVVYLSIAESAYYPSVVFAFVAANLIFVEDELDEFVGEEGLLLREELFEFCFREKAFFEPDRASFVRHDNLATSSIDVGIDSCDINLRESCIAQHLAVARVDCGAMRSFFFDLSCCC